MGLTASRGLSGSLAPVPVTCGDPEASAVRWLPQLSHPARAFIKQGSIWHLEPSLSRMGPMGRWPTDENERRNSDNLKPGQAGAGKHPGPGPGPAPAAAAGGGPLLAGAKRKVPNYLQVVTQGAPAGGVLGPARKDAAVWGGRACGRRPPRGQARARVPMSRWPGARLPAGVRYTCGPGCQSAGESGTSSEGHGTPGTQPSSEKNALTAAAGGSRGRILSPGRHGLHKLSMPLSARESRAEREEELAQQAETLQ